MTQANGKPVVYYENWLLKKEGVNKWVVYWAVIRGRWLQFFERENNEIRPQLRKTLELTKTSKCSLVKRNKNRFPFSLDNGVSVYYLKCDSELERYHWIFSILMSALNKPKVELPNIIPSSMKEKEAFRKTTKEERIQQYRIQKEQQEQKRTQIIQVKDQNNEDTSIKVPTGAFDVENRRRRKFAVRKENKQKKKETARLKKLGIQPPPELAMQSYKSKHGEENTKLKEQLQQEIATRDRLGHFEMIHVEHTPIEIYESNNEQQPRKAKPLRIKSDEIIQPLHGTSPSSKNIRNPARRPVTTNTSNDKREDTYNENKVTVTAMVHPPSNKQKQQQGLIRREKQCFVNNGFDVEDEIETLPTVPVILDDNENVLPNMVFIEVSDDSDSEETGNTEEISICSENSLSSLASLNPGTTSTTSNKVNNTVIISKTILSDDDFKQIDSRGHIISSPDFFRPKTPSSGLATPVSPIKDSLHMKPLSPMQKRHYADKLRLDSVNARPLTPSDTTTKENSEDLTYSLHNDILTPGSSQV